MSVEPDETEGGEGGGARPWRATSSEAYHDLLETGRLDRMGEEVLQALAKRGPSTGTELDAWMNNVSAHKRLSELREEGRVRFTRRRRCSVSGRNALEWDLIRAPSEKQQAPPPSKKKKKLKDPDMAHVRAAMTLFSDLSKDLKAQDHKLPEGVELFFQWVGLRFGIPFEDP